MAAQVTRETGVPVNRKQIQRIYRKTGYIEPQKTKNDIMRAKRKLFKPKAPNQLWETDITYLWCGSDGWCYSFNVIDCFTRQWIAYVFDTNATRHVAIESLTQRQSQRQSRTAPGCGCGPTTETSTRVMTLERQSRPWE